METCFNYCDKDVAFFSSDEKRWINKIRKLKKQHPDEIKILAEPETNDGCIYCRLPAYTLQIRFKREYTEEERKAIADRLTGSKKTDISENTME